MMGLKGSSEADAFVAFYFAREDEPMLQLLNSIPQPPIIGKCVGAAQSEYARSGQTLIEVQMRACSILPLASAQPTQKRQASKPISSYDSGFSEGYSNGKANCDQYNRLPDPKDFSGLTKESYELQRKRYREDVFPRMLNTYDDIFELKSANRKQVGEDDFQRCKGMLEGYRKALREAGLSF